MYRPVDSVKGYGGSSARKVTEDYSLESINNGMVALLQHLGREDAVWVGHDWGCGAVWVSSDA